MKSLSVLLLLAVIVGQLGCYAASEVSNTPEATSAAKTYSGQTTDTATQKSTEQPIQPVSLTVADSAETVAAAADRKIIKNAELTIEVNSPADTQGSISSIAASHGGFVVTSETKEVEANDPAKRRQEVKLVARIPADRFDAALTSIEKLALHVLHRGISGSDVTEEFIDLEARIKTQKALELQFLQIMKQANNISDSLEVQRQIAGVRTEIEKLEGRKRFLENRASLSTITVEIKTPVLIAVNTSSFGRHLRESVSDSVEIGSAILLGLTRAVIVMIPIVIFILLPIGLIASVFVRRVRRMRLEQPLNVAPVSE